MPTDAGQPDDSAPQLLQRAARGDPDAFALVYRRYKDVVYRFARAMTGSTDAAEDVTQEVFVALIRDVSKYDASRASFSTYVYGIVRNLTRERLRRDRRLLSLDAVPMLRRAHTGGDGPLDQLECAQRAALVRRALRELPWRYREVIVLCDLHALSYGEAAAVVRVSVAAVRSRLHRGRQLLRRRLGRIREPACGSMNPARCAI